MATCAACRSENPDRAKFCFECGAALHPADVERRERRVVSVLFCDLVGFTSRSERLDVEEVGGFLSGFHRLLRGELERHGGTVEKFIGDAVMALFGAPVAHEDDAERAVRAALAIQDAVAELRTRGDDVHVRVGVTTGEALVSFSGDPSRGEGMAAGDVVNTAARIQAAAPTDGVLVDESTHRATDRGVRYVDADPIAAKGKAEPVRVWLAVETRSTLPEPPRTNDLPLVGRRAEADLLIAALERSQSDPSTQLVTVVGSPGIGKSRLVEVLAQHVDELPGLIRWRRGRSLAYGERVAFWALGEMVKAQAGILESDTRADATTKLLEAVDATVVAASDREWVARHLRPLVGLDTAGASSTGGRVEAFAAWRRFFEALAEDGPTVLVFEDMHWADDGLLDFVDLLADRAGAIPLLIVCTARPELLERRPSWGGGKINALTINLAPLSAPDTARLLGELLNQALLPAQTQHALLERAEGNPLYAQEYVRMLRDQRILVADAGGWRLVGDTHGVPDSIHAIIAARLDTLTDGERAFIQDASVAGRTAWLGAIEEISQVPSWELEELLHTLERKQLMIRVRRSSVEGEVEFTFAHALTQEVAYQQIRRTERADKHERVAEWIERLAGERDDKSELLAHHYAAALDLRSQAGEDASRLAPRLVRARLEAGRQALAVYAHATAARHFAAALELSPPDDPSRAPLLADLATAAYHAGTADEALFEEALRVQVAERDWAAAAEVCLAYGRWLDKAAGLGDRSEALFEQGFSYATRDGYTPTASQVAREQALRLIITGRSPEAVPFCQLIIDQAEAARDVEGAALVRLMHGDARLTSGDLDGIEEMHAAARTLTARSHPSGALAYLNLAESLMALGDYPGAAHARAEAQALAERYGESFTMRFAAAGRAEDELHAGNWPAALRMLNPLADYSADVIASYARWMRGRILLGRGDLEAAKDDAEYVLGYGSRSGNDEFLHYGLALQALVADARGVEQDAAAISSRLFERWHEIGGMLSLANVLAELAQLPSQHAAIGSAAALLPESARWRSVLSAVGEERFAEAADLYRLMGSRALEAMMHLLAAQTHDGAARRDHALAAHEFYAAAGATTFADRAMQLRRATA